MLDNFYLAQQSLRQVREDMPRSFYRQLPKLVAGPLQGYPRIYDLAQRLVSDSDARLDMEFVRRFVCRSIRRFSRSPSAKSGPCRSCSAGASSPS